MCAFRTNMSDISDEEIDSEGFVSGYSDDDFGLGSGIGEEGVLLSDLLSANAKESGTSTTPSEQVARQEITSRAKLLRKGNTRTLREDDGALEPLLHSDSDDGSGSDDDDALQQVVLAATGRDLRQRQVRQAALNVEQGIGEEDPLAAPLASGRSGRETMDKLLSALEGSGSRNLGALKKRVGSQDKDGKKALDAPLPEVVAGRIERAAAYKKTTAEVSEKWADVVKTNRRAKNLKFPLGEPARAVHQNTANVVAGFKPENDFENEIEKLLREGGVVSEKDVMTLEEKELTSTVSKEELIARRRELAKMRSLMFEYERKMKRISKIKSKKFRRIMKNEKMRLKEEQGEMSGSDLEDMATGRMAAEKRRAEERMTLRHKNTSKWVKRQLSRGETKRNPETRAAIEEQLRMHEELKRRQEGVMDLSDSERGESDGEISALGSDVEALDNELGKMKSEMQNDAGKKRKGGKTGLMNMKFMQAAAERERKDALELLKDMGSDEEEGLDEYGSDNDVGSAGVAKRAQSTGPVGRQSFSGSTETPKQAEEHEAEKDGIIDDSDEEGEALDRRIREEYDNEAAVLGEGSAVRGVPISSLENVVREGNDTPAGFVTTLEGRLSAKAGEISDLNVKSGPEEVEAVNTLCDEKTLSTKASREPNEVNGRPAAHRSVINGGGSSKPSGTKKRVRFDDQCSGFDGEKSKKNPSKQPKIITAKHNKPVVAAIGDSIPKSTVDGDKLIAAGAPEQSRKRKAGRQESVAEAKDRARMELVARAFAGLGGADEAEFAASKSAEVEQDINAETSANATKVLPGWGSWDGAGARKKRRKSAFAEAAQKKLEEAKANAVKKRADRHNKELHLSVKRSKSAAALTLAAVPFPFRSREEWEREVSVPIVREVVAGRAFRSSIQERVTVKKGAVIEPVREGMVPGVSKTRAKAKGKQGVIERRKHTAKAREDKRRALLS